MSTGSDRRRSLLLFLVLAAAGVLLAGLPSAAAAGGDPPPYVPDATAPRKAVPDVYKWDLTPLFATPEAWEQGRTRLAGEIPSLATYQGRLGDPAALRNCLDLYFRLHDQVNHLTLYANLELVTAQSDDAARTRQQQSLTVMDDLMRTAAFIRSEVLTLDDDQMARAYAAPNGPAVYRAYLDNLRRRRARVLPPDAERVLGLAGDNLWAEIDLNELPSPLEDAFGALLTDIPWPVVHDAQGREVQLTLANISRLRASPDRAVRREAVTAFLATLRQYQHALAATLGGQFRLDVTYARARHYDTALQAYLDKDDIDPDVYDNLIATVNDHLEPLHRYVELRRKALGLPDLHLYDLYVPFVPDVEDHVTFAEARRILPVALAPLGKDYVALLEQGLDPANGWLDLYPSLDKESGAFSSSVYGSHPYVKMNYQDTRDDLSTLAHEFGHALHSDLAMKNQPYWTFRYVPFLAEIASTCNEALLADYLIAQAPDRAHEAALLVERLEGIRTTIYRQTLFSEFERAAHAYVEEGTPLTASLLEQTYRDLVQRYYGPGFTVDPDDGMEWAYIPHFYYKYYVYTYATGLSCGLTLAERIRQNGAPAVDAYLGMLKGGCAQPPLVLLKGAGVDLTRPDAITTALQLFDRTLDQLEKLLNP